jgi:hypothetical protein
LTEASILGNHRGLVSERFRHSHLSIPAAKEILWKPGSIAAHVIRISEVGALDGPL